MSRKWLGIGLFALGALFIHTMTTFAFFLSMVGVSALQMPQIAGPKTGMEYMFLFLSNIVPIGSVLMVVGGLVFKQEAGR
ncbi:MAG: hypothetical protein AB1597_00290 [Chloroflexota bacterium]